MHKYINKGKIYLLFMFVSDKIELRETEKGMCVFAVANINKTEVVIEFEKRFVSTPTKYTLQIDETKFQISKNRKAIENFINHSCDANGYIDFNDLTFRALRKIEKGEELSLNYNSTEWDMTLGADECFQCKCYSNICLGKISGFSHLNKKDQLKLLSTSSPFIKQMFEKTYNKKLPKMLEIRR